LAVDHHGFTLANAFGNDGDGAGKALADYDRPELGGLIGLDDVDVLPASEV